jgi:imidazolonepropionase-like amidohydrolase
MQQTGRGFIVGGFTDHHVHLQLIDHVLLADSVLGRVIDLGGTPAVLADLQVGIDVDYAGAFLTPPGGYPSMRSWAPQGSVREIYDVESAARAVAEMKSAGAVCIKVASNRTAGSVFSDDMLRIIIELATEESLPVIAHAEGPGEAQRVAALGVDLLAHAPFSEPLTDDEIAVQAASVQWVSTLAIHAGPTYETAVDNVRRFHAAGGIVLYGTDLGNGPSSVDLSEREIRALREAGIDGEDLLRALAPVDGGRQLFIPGDVPDPLLARPLTPEDLED